MILSDIDIAARLAAGDLKIKGLTARAMQPASIELHLGRQFLAYSRPERIIQVDPTDDYRPQMLPIIPDDDGSVLLTPQFAGGPNSFLLAHTAETITIPIDLCARIEGKSSLGRIGLAAHVAAGFVDCGFTGQVVLELFNVSPVPIRLHPGMAVAQLCLFAMTSAASAPYGDKKFGSHYQGQTGAQAAAAVGRRTAPVI